MGDRIANAARTCFLRRTDRGYICPRGFGTSLSTTQYLAQSYSFEDWSPGEGRHVLLSEGAVADREKCKEDRTAWVTTLLDLHALPKDFPGADDQLSGGEEARSIERAMEEDIQQPKFIANILVHEFEGLLFSYPPAFGPNLPGNNIVATLTAIRDQFETPEHINDGPMSAPSKRILGVCRSYEKVFHGALVALDIGLDRIRQECHHFRTWIERLESL